MAQQNLLKHPAPVKKDKKKRREERKLEKATHNKEAKLLEKVSENGLITVTKSKSLPVVDFHAGGTGGTNMTKSSKYDKLKNDRLSANVNKSSKNLNEGTATNINGTTKNIDSSFPPAKYSNISADKTKDDDSTSTSSSETSKKARSVDFSMMREFSLASTDTVRTLPNLPPQKGREKASSLRGENNLSNIGYGTTHILSSRVTDNASIRSGSVVSESKILQKSKSSEMGALNNSPRLSHGSANNPNAWKPGSAALFSGESFKPFEETAKFQEQNAHIPNMDHKDSAVHIPFLQDSEQDKRSENQIIQKLPTTDSNALIASHPIVVTSPTGELSGNHQDSKSIISKQNSSNLQNQNRPGYRKQNSMGGASTSRCSGSMTTNNIYTKKKPLFTRQGSMAMSARSSVVISSPKKYGTSAIGCTASHENKQSSFAQGGRHSAINKMYNRTHNQTNYSGSRQGSCYHASPRSRVNKSSRAHSQDIDGDVHSFRILNQNNRTWNNSEHENILLNEREFAKNKQSAEGIFKENVDVLLFSAQLSSR